MEYDKGMWITYEGKEIEIKKMSVGHIEHCILYLECRILTHSVLLLGYKRKETRKKINRRINELCKKMVEFVRELKRRKK